MLHPAVIAKVCDPLKAAAGWHLTVVSDTQIVPSHAVDAILVFIVRSDIDDVNKIK
jgi:hypothetical protein